MYTIDGLMINIGVQSEGASTGIEKLANNLNKLNTAANKNVGLDNIKSQLADVNTQSKKLLSFSKSLVSLAAVTKTLTAGIQKSNEYVENLNLFRVALGRYADQAQRYAEAVESIIGIDSSEWMRNQGIFMQIATGFGMAEERAYKLSKALTQVSYDIASFYNISTEESMLKVRSGISGELEPLRNLGYALDTATLQQIAYANGINMKVTAMTQAQKAELRYVAIMSQSKNAINDMSKTYNTSANQIRVLTSQVNVLARSFGNILIPAINAVLPVVINFVNILTSALNAIASLFGFTIPTVDWSSSGISDASDAAGSLDDNLGSASGSAKKLQRVLMGFDELNVMPDTASGGGGSGGGSSAGGYGGSLGINIDDYMYDFLDGMYKKVTDVNLAVAGVAAALAGLAIPAATMLGWKTLSNIAGGLIVAAAQLRLNFELASAYIKEGNVSYLIGQIGVTSLAGGIFTTILTNMGLTKDGKNWRWGFSGAMIADIGVSLAAEYKGISEGEVDPFSKEVIIEDVKNVIEAATSGFLLGGIKGAAIGLTLGLLATLAVKKVAIDNANNRFAYGDVTASADEIKDYAETLLGKNVIANLTLVETNIEGLELAQENLDAAVSVLNASTRLVTLGIDTSPEAAKQIGSDAQSVIAEAQKLLEEQKASLSVLVSITPPKDENGGDIGAQYMDALNNSISALQEGYEYLGGKMTEWITAGATDGLEPFEQQMIAEYSQAIQNISTALSKGQIQGENIAKLEFALADLDKGSFKEVFAEIENINKQVEESAMASAQEQYAALTSNLYALQAMRDAMLIEEGGADSQAYKDIENEIKAAQAALDAFDVNATAQAYIDEFSAIAKPKIVEAIAGWLALGDNASIIGENIVNDTYHAIRYAAETGNYSATATALTDAIEVELANAGIDLSSVGLTGYDMLTEELKGILQNAFVKTDIPPEVLDNVFSGAESMGGALINAFNYAAKEAKIILSSLGNDLVAKAKKTEIKYKVGLDVENTRLRIKEYGLGSTGSSVVLLEKFAGGGIPDYGTMFIAGESGPELVGKIGNKTGVVNSGQISDIIAAEMARQGGSSGSDEDAIARAVAAALNNMEIKVDGDSFGRIAVKTINKRRQTSGKVELIL